MHSYAITALALAGFGAAKPMIPSAYGQSSSSSPTPYDSITKPTTYSTVSSKTADSSSSSSTVYSYSTTPSPSLSSYKPTYYTNTTASSSTLPPKDSTTTAITYVTTSVCPTSYTSSGSVYQTYTLRFTPSPAALADVTRPRLCRQAATLANLSTELHQLRLHPTAVSPLSRLHTQAPHLAHLALVRAPAW